MFFPIYLYYFFFSILIVFNSVLFPIISYYYISGFQCNIFRLVDDNFVITQTNRSQTKYDIKNGILTYIYIRSIILLKCALL